MERAHDEFNTVIKSRRKEQNEKKLKLAFWLAYDFSMIRERTFQGTFF